MELVITEIEGSVDWLKRLEVYIDFFLFSFISDDGTTVNDEAVRWYFRVELQALLDRGYGAEYRKAINATLYIGGGTEFVSEHLGDAGNLVFRWND